MFQQYMSYNEPTRWNQLCKSRNKRNGQIPISHFLSDSQCIIKVSYSLLIIAGLSRLLYLDVLTCRLTIVNIFFTSFSRCRILSRCRLLFHCRFYCLLSFLIFMYLFLCFFSRFLGYLGQFLRQKFWEKIKKNKKSQILGKIKSRCFFNLFMHKRHLTSNDMSFSFRGRVQPRKRPDVFESNPSGFLAL